MNNLEKMDVVCDFYRYLLDYTYEKCLKDNPGTSFETYLEIALRSYCDNKYGVGFPK
jgi:hypothetical protein